MHQCKGRRGIAKSSQSESRKSENKKYAISSLICALLALILPPIGMFGAGAAVASLLSPTLYFVGLALIPVGMLLGVASIVLGVLAIKKRNGKKKAIAGIVIGVISLIVGALAGLMAGVIHGEVVEKGHLEYATMIRSATESPELVQRGKELGLARIDEVPVYRIDQDNLFNLESRDGGTVTRGCYEGATCEVVGIFIRNGLEGSHLDAILAHEYLHVVWYLDNLNNDDPLFKDLSRIYNTVPEMQSVSLKNYTEQERTTNEMFAYSCTDASDKHLTKRVLDLCNKYIDRSKIELLY